MYENIIIPGLYAAICFLLVLNTISQFRLVRLRKAMKQQSDLTETLKNDVRALFSGAVGEDERIFRLEKRTRRIKERQEQIENSHHAERPYEQAIRMVQKGTSIEDLMSVCNLSKGEADLIMMMHGDDKLTANRKEQFH